MIYVKWWRNQASNNKNILEQYVPLWFGKQGCRGAKNKLIYEIAFFKFLKHPHRYLEKLQYPPHPCPLILATSHKKPAILWPGLEKYDKLYPFPEKKECFNKGKRCIISHLMTTSTFFIFFIFSEHFSQFLQPVCKTFLLELQVCCIFPFTFVDVENLAKKQFVWIKEVNWIVSSFTELFCINLLLNFIFSCW